MNKTIAYFAFKHTFYFPKTPLYGIGCLDYPGSQHSYIGIDTGIVFVRTPIAPGYDAHQLAIGHQRTSRVACASIRISACGANGFLAYKIRTVATKNQEKMADEQPNLVAGHPPACKCTSIGVRVFRRVLIFFH